MSVTVQDVVKRFSNGPGAAVGGVSFSAPSGKITTLLGPSGSGKTTLLRMIAGLELPDEGRISIADRDVTQVSARERGIGLVFQSYALFGHMTVAENIGFGLRIRGRGKAEIAAKVKELLALVQLSGLEARLPSELSGGQRQRIALARALAPDPSVLLLDEPFGALDTKVRVELRAWLHQLHERTGITTLLVTHDQDEALELSQHVVLLEAGKVAQAGTPHELYDAPATPFVASFLGATALPAPTDPRDADFDAPRGKVDRVVRVGGYAKVWVLFPEGNALAVQLARSELERLGLEPGDDVALVVAEAKVFGGNYAI
jgi:sulfate/thiosulfate transport system ATP-binding protein